MMLIHQRKVTKPWEIYTRVASVKLPMWSQ